MKVVTVIIIVWILFFFYIYKKQEKTPAHCDSDASEKQLSKRISLIAIGFGVFIWLLSYVFVNLIYN